MIISIQKLINELFGADKKKLSKVNSLLSKYDFLKNFKAIEEKINQGFEESVEEINFSQLSANFLTIINSKLSIIPEEDKKELEEINSRLGQAILYIVLSQHPEPEKFINEVSSGFNESIQNNSWNKEEFLKQLNIDVIASNRNAVSKNSAPKKSMV